MTIAPEKNGSSRPHGARHRRLRRGHAQPDDLRPLRARRRCAARRGSPRAGRSSSTPARSPAARRRTSSPSASRRRSSGSGGRPARTAISREEHFEGLRAKVAGLPRRPGAALRRRRLRRRRPAAPDLAARRHADGPTTRSSRRRCSSRRARASWPSFEPEALVLHAPGLEADPAEDGTRTGTFIVFHPTRREILIGGTYYAGEIKKGIFTLMNDSLPLEGVLPMHCSANVGDAGDVAVFFGLSGTGKTTLSADPGAQADRRRRARLGRQRRLQLRGRLLREDDQSLAGGRAGDLRGDERVRHGARERRRSTSAAASTSTTRRRPRTPAPPTSWSGSRTRCRRSGPGTRRTSSSSTADAFGDPAADRAADLRPGPLLLPLRLHLQARRHRDRRHRARADLLDLLRRAVPAAAAGGLLASCSAQKLEQHRPSVWLVNTGWTGGPYGEGQPDADPGDAGAAARRALGRARRGSSTAPTTTFGFEVPVEAPGVDAALLDPRSTWRDPAAYDRKARELAAMFRENFERFPDAGDAVRPRGRGSDAAARRPFGSVSGWRQARRPRRRRRLRGHARRDRGVRRRRRRRDDLEAAPDPQPLRRGRGRHQRGARERRRGLPEIHAYDTVKGSDYIGDQDAIEVFCARGARRHLPARALGRRLLAARRRQARAAAVRRRRLAAHGLRGRHHRPRADPGALRAGRASATSRSTRSTSPGSSSRTTAAARA